MEFADGVVRVAWERQGGRCAKCGRWLVWTRRGRESITGAWQPHRRSLEDGCRDTPANCIILCSGIANCHLKEGHAGVDRSHHAPLDHTRLLFLHAGEEEAQRTPKAPSARQRSLIRSFMGISQAPAAKRSIGQKRKARTGSPNGAMARGENEACELGSAADQ